MSDEEKTPLVSEMDAKVFDDAVFGDLLLPADEIPEVAPPEATSSIISVLNENLSSQANLKVFLEKNPDAYDVLFVFQDRSIPALKSVIGSTSSYFADLFFSGTYDSKEVVVKNVDAELFEKYVKYVHFDVFPTLNRGRECVDALGMFRFIQEYGILPTFPHAVTCCLEINSANFLVVFTEAVELRSVVLKDHCLQFLMNIGMDEFGEVTFLWKTEDVWKTLEFHVFKELVVLLRTRVFPENGESHRGGSNLIELFEDEILGLIVSYYAEHEKMEMLCLDLLHEFVDWKNVNPITLSKYRKGENPLFKRINPELLLLGFMGRELSMTSCYIHESIPQNCSTRENLVFRSVFENTLETTMLMEMEVRSKVPPPPNIEDFRFYSSGNGNVYPDRDEYEDLDEVNVSTTVRNTFGKCIRDLLDSGCGNDVLFVVGKEKMEIKGVRAVLAANSEFFRTLLYGRMKESNEKVIHIECEIAKAFESVIYYLLFGKCEIEYEYVLAVLALATEYMIHDLSDFLNEAIKDVINEENCIDLLKSSIVLENHEIFNCCIEKLRRNLPATVLTCDRLLDSTQDVLEEYIVYLILLFGESPLFYSKGVHNRNEESCNFHQTLYNLIYKWGKGNDAENAQMKYLMEKYVDYKWIEKFDLLPMKRHGIINEDLLWVSLYSDSRVGNETRNFDNGGMKDLSREEAISEFPSLPKECATLDTLQVDSQDFQRMLNGFIPSAPPIKEFKEKKEKKKGKGEFAKFLRDFAEDWVEQRDSQNDYHEYDEEFDDDDEWEDYDDDDW